MAYKDDLSVGTVIDGLKQHTNAILKAIDEAADYAVRLTDAQDGQSAKNWGRSLYNQPDTKKTTLTITASTKVVSCPAGAGLFSGFQVSREVQITQFTNGGNNQTTLITAVAADGDSITIGNATGLVDETDTDARVRQNPLAEEEDVVDAIIATRARFTELKDALDNTAVTTADRRADLMDWVW